MSPGRTLVKRKTSAETTSSVPTASVRRWAMSLRIKRAPAGLRGRCLGVLPGPPYAGGPVTRVRSTQCACLLLALKLREIELHELDRRNVTAAVRALGGDDPLERRDDLPALLGQHLPGLLVELAAGGRVHGGVGLLDQRVELRHLPVRLRVRSVLEVGDRQRQPRGAGRPGR